MIAAPFGMPIPRDDSFNALLARIDEADRRWRQSLAEFPPPDPDTGH